VDRFEIVERQPRCRVRGYESASSAACSGFFHHERFRHSSFSVPRATEERDSTVRMSWISRGEAVARRDVTLAKIGSRERIARCQIESCRAVWSSTSAEIDDQAVSSAIVMNRSATSARAFG